MKPTIGRTVLVMGISSNGSHEHPAVITRVWQSHDCIEGPVTVNLTVFPDNAAPAPRSSVPLFETHEDARTSGSTIAAYWPPRD